MTLAVIKGAAMLIVGVMMIQRSCRSRSRFYRWGLAVPGALLTAAGVYSLFDF